MATQYMEPDKSQVSLFEPHIKHYQFDFYGEILVPRSYIFLDAYFQKKLKLHIFRFIEPIESELFLREVDQRQNPQNSRLLGSFTVKPKKIGSGISHPQLMDLNSDGKDELLLVLDTTYPRFPRELACFDFETGNLLWEYPFGPSFNDWKIKDLDNDNCQEIVLSTFANSNGAEINGTSDAFSYIIVLNSSGREIWKQIIGGWYTLSQFKIFDLDKDGRFEIIATRASHRAVSELRGKITIFDALTGQPEATFPSRDASFSNPVVLNDDGGNPRIYVGDSKGNIRMFDKGLTVLKRVSVRSPVKVLNTPLRTQAWDFISVLSENNFQIFDKELKTKQFHFSLEHSIDLSLNENVYPSFIPLRTREGNHALIGADKLYILSWAKPPFSKILKSAFTTGLLTTIIILILFNIYIFLTFRALYLRGHKNLQRKQDSWQLFEMVQEVAHQVKNPLSTILFSAERIKGILKKVKSAEVKNELAQVSEFLSDDVNTLKQHTSHIMKLIAVQQPKFQEKEIKPLLEAVVNRYRHLESEGIDIELDMDDDITLYLDEELLKGALCNLLDNAVDAVGEKGKIKVSVIPVSSPVKKSLKEVMIEIEDTGCGISSEDLSQIFKPHFSTREGGMGLGLTIARRIIEAHGGHIDVHSRKGFGTRFALHLPIRGK